MIYPGTGINAEGRLTFGGADAVRLAEKYGTPLYLLDADRVRNNIRTHIQASAAAFPDGSRAVYAAKALCFLGICRICAEEGIGVDAVSQGELLTAFRAGVDPSLTVFHGNAKSPEDIAFAIDHRVGLIVSDNENEVLLTDRIAREKETVQDVLLRLTPGVDPHTFDAVNTGRTGSKFGASIETGAAESLFRLASSCPGVRVRGFHCHIGSQIFDAEPYLAAVRIMVSFIGMIRDKYGFCPEILDLGGGFGVRYTDEDPEPDLSLTLEKIGKRLAERCVEAGLPLPAVITEPGRSVAADAGMTLYTVRDVKRIPGVKTFAAVDGGMTDNPRYALYRAKYGFVNADRASAPADFLCTVAGRCCESGDLLSENVKIAEPAPGERLAVFTTGAYNFSMASNYNSLPMPPLVMISGGREKLAVRRQTSEDLLSRQI